MREYTRLKPDAFKELLKNAGILLVGKYAFNAVSGSFSEDAILCATSGGLNFNDSPSFEDFASDIDNAPRNTMQFKELTGREIRVSGTGLTLDNRIAKMLMIADADLNNENHFIPRDVLEENDFQDIWFITDYGNKDGSYCAVHIMNCLSTAGFQIQTTDRGKGQLAFEFMAHFDANDTSLVPYEVYMKDSTEYTYTEATVTDGFEIGKVYYTRSGSEGSYIYTKVTSGAASSEETYYTRSES